MRRIALIVVTMAASVAVVPAAAARPPRSFVLETATGALAPGSAIEMSSSDFVFEDGLGHREECSSAVLRGTLESNDEAVVNVRFESASLESPGAPHNDCTTNAPLPIVTSIHMEALALPWTLTLDWRKTPTLAGSAGVVFGVRTPPEGCGWKAKKLVAELGGPLSLSMPGPEERLTLVDPGPFCAFGGHRKALVTANWALASEGEPITYS
jgi:hypothetical protein